MTTTDMTSSDLVAAEVRARLGRHGLTQAQAAEQAGMSRTAFSDRLTGRRPFDVEQLEDIAEVFGVDALDILRGAAAGRCAG